MGLASMTEVSTLTLIARLSAFVAILQTTELIYLRTWFASEGIWDWQTLRHDYDESPALVRAFLDRYFANFNFPFLLWFRLIVSLVVLAHPDLFGTTLLFLTAFMICVRFRGTFNGGSDSMTLLTLLAVTVGFIKPQSEFYAHLGLCMITAFVVISYTIAGLSKLKNPSWRNGEALNQLMKTSRWATIKTVPLKFALLASWTTLIFEGFFAFSLAAPIVCIGFLSAGVVFHWLNHRLLGLNRFFWAWVITYPAVLSIARHLTH